MQSAENPSSSPATTPSPDAAALTYRDVQIVLALIDTWPSGDVRFAKGDLAIEATLDGSYPPDRLRPSIAPRLIVRSPAVGTFQPASTLSGEKFVQEADIIGSIVAPGRTTPVPAGADGEIAEILVAAGDFVEYGQALVAISGSAK